MSSVVSDARQQVQSGVRRQSLTVGAVTTAVTVAGVLYAVLKNPGADSSQTNSLPFVAGAAVVAGILVFAWLAPARIAAHGTGLPFAIISVPFIAAFWSGLPIVVAGGAVLIGYAYRQGEGSKRGRALAAIIIGGLVAVLTLGAILVG
jgi:hypothetical protein